MIQYNNKNKLEKYLKLFDVCHFHYRYNSSGKSLLTSYLLEGDNSNDITPISINLDPGVSILPYEPDVDVRDFIHIYSIMENII